jgi:hypothetical protein
MRKSDYLSRTVWNRIPPGLRRAVLARTGLRRTELVDNGKFVCNLLDELRTRGEHHLADLLLPRSRRRSSSTACNRTLWPSA